MAIPNKGVPVDEQRAMDITIANLRAELERKKRKPKANRKPKYLVGG